MVLINIVLNSLPIYYMSLFLMPTVVRKSLISIQNKFLWWGDFEKKCIYPIKRSVVELPKSAGGLGVGCLLFRNLALLFKWWWRFSEEMNFLWKRVVCSVHDILDYKANSVLFESCDNGI